MDNHRMGQKHYNDPVSERILMGVSMNAFEQVVYRLMLLIEVGLIKPNWAAWVWGDRDA